MKQVRPVQGQNLTEFADALNAAYAELSRCTIERTDNVAPLQALIYYDDPDGIPEPDEIHSRPDADYIVDLSGGNVKGQTIRIDVTVGEAHDSRYCCECDNYSWGQGCPYSTDRRKLKDPACGMFNVRIEGRF